MTIRNVNGRNVYVLSPRPVTGTFSNGQSIATFYSDLRWQIWEEIQKSELAKLQVEQMSAKARADIFEQSQRDLRRAITDLQQLRAEAMAGGSTANQVARTMTEQAKLDFNAQKTNAQLALRAQEQQTRAAQRAFEEREVEETRSVDPFGEPFEGGPVTETTRTTITRGEAPAPLTPAPQITAPRITAPRIGEVPPDEEDADRRGGSIEFLDSEIKRLEDELRRDQERYRQSLGGQTDFDLLNRSRRAFQQEIGVIGEGGGPFGLAPRPRRQLPRVDQPVARQRIEEFTPTLVEMQATAEAERNALRDIFMRKAEMRALGVNVDDPNAQINQQIAAQRARIAEAEAPLEMLQTAIPRRRAGELLLRDRPMTAAETRSAFAPISPPSAVEMPPAEPDGLYPVPGRSMAEIRALFGTEGDEVGETQEPYGQPAGSGGQMAPVSLGGLSIPPAAPAATPPPIEGPPRITPSTTAPVTPSTTAPVTPPATDFEMPAAVPPGRITPATPSQVIEQTGPITDPEAQNEAEKIKQDLEDFQKDTIPQELIDRARAFYRETTIQVDGGELRPIMETFESDKDMVGSYLLDIVRRDTPVQQYLPEGIEQQIEDEMEQFRGRSLRRSRRPERARKASTRMRKDRYKLNVITEGTKLAETPKRLERLAKTQLEDEARPEHFVIVDKLYETNKGKDNAFRLTYDEINRVYANDPEKRKEAHTYLVAKDILESNITEPLA